MPTNQRHIKHRGGPVWKRKRGAANNYINVTKILRKLDLTLKDFRRLCILKGLHPRNAPHKKDKLYYHKKDVTFLSHEPLIRKFRLLKTFLKRYKRAVGRGHKDTAKRVKELIPEITVDHLIRERYPTFFDAVRDYDDALNQLFLFRSLPVGVTISYTGPVANRVERVCAEWHKYIADYKLLRKVFVSIKGYYLQADVCGTPVTWRVPHHVIQRAKQDGVDMSIMTTFLHFYQTMARFLNFKLFKDEGVSYPPRLATETDEVEAIFGKGVHSVASQRTAAAASLRAKNATKLSAKSKNLQALVDKVSAKLVNEDSTEDPESKRDNDNKTDDTEEFNRLDPSLATEEDARGDRLTSLFKGMVFLIGREVPPEVISVVIRSAGGKCIHEHLLTPAQTSSSVFTHQISDRKRPSTIIASRTYIQPQWIFDSFNEAFLLPIAPYALGEKLPPHLSPFVGTSGHVPEQRHILRQWVGNTKVSAKSGQPKKINEEREETKYHEELKAEIMAVRKAQKASRATATSDDEEEDMESEDDMDEDDMDEDEDADADEEEEDVEEGEEEGEMLEVSEDDDLDLEESGDEEDEDEAISRVKAAIKRRAPVSESEEEEDEEEEDDEFAQFEAPKPAVPRPEKMDARDTEKERFRMTLKKSDRYMFDKLQRKTQHKNEKIKLLGAKRSAIKSGGDPNEAVAKKFVKRSRNY